MGFKARTGPGRGMSRPAPKAKTKTTKTRREEAVIEPLDNVIRRTIANALAVHGSLRAAARALEIPYSSLRDKAEKYGLLAAVARKPVTRKPVTRRPVTRKEVAKRGPKRAAVKRTTKRAVTQTRRRKTG